MKTDNKRQTTRQLDRREKLAGLCLSISLCVLALSSCVLGIQSKKISLSDYGLHAGDTLDGQRFVMLVDSLSEVYPQGIELNFEPGTYYLEANRSPKRQLYISNHDQVLEPRPVGLLLESKAKIQLGSKKNDKRVELVCLDDMLPIALINCKDVSLAGLSIDFREPSIVQSRIVENRGEDGIVFEPAPWVRWRITEGGEFEAYGRSWTSRLGTGIAFDSKTRRTLYRVSDLTYTTKGAQQLPKGQILAPEWRDARLPEGTIIAMRSYERPQPAVFVDASEGIELLGVDIHFAQGMGVLVQNSKDISLIGTNVYPSTHRYFSTQADATHFVACRGEISVVGGRFEAMMDDAINVHGIYLKLTKRIDDYTIIGQYMHPQAWGFEWGRAGETVRFLASKSFDILGEENEIKHIRPLDRPSVEGAKSFEIQVSKALPKEIDESAEIGIENLTREPSVRFVNCTVSNNRARGALLNSSKPIQVLGNTFSHISGSAILVSSDCSMWYESGQTSEMYIRGNTFEDVLTSLYQFTEAVISICPVIPELEMQKLPFYGAKGVGIVIEGNTFKTFDTPLFYGKSVERSRWSGNTIVKTLTYPPFHHNKEIFTLVGSKPIEVVDSSPGEL